MEWISGVSYGAFPRMTFVKFLVRPPIEFRQAAQCARAQVSVGGSPITSFDFFVKKVGPYLNDVFQVRFLGLSYFRSPDLPEIMGPKNLIACNSTFE